ncbi:DUF736 domain-containing protein, partial [Rhizobium leguminosarum bv. viciae]
MTPTARPLLRAPSGMVPSNRR